MIYSISGTVDHIIYHRRREHDERKLYTSHRVCNSSNSCAAKCSSYVRIRIPDGLRVGDTFVVTQDDGRVFTVVVPEGAFPGCELEVVVPETAQSSGPYPPPNEEMHVKKSTAGAAVAGAVVGAIVLGPVGALLLAGGAAYATT